MGETTDMATAAQQEREAMTETDLRVVRKTTDATLDFVNRTYSDVKNTKMMNGLVAYGVESGEAIVGRFDWLYQPLVTKICTMGDPLVDVVDEKLDMVLKTTQDRVVDARDTLVTQAHERVIDPALLMRDTLVTQAQEHVITPVHERVISPVMATAQTRVIDPVQEHVISPVVNTAQTRVITPVRNIHSSLDLDQDGKVSLADLQGVSGQVREKVREKAVHHWNSIRGDLSKKTALRLEQGLEHVKYFSGNQLKSVIHVDLIEYSQSLLDSTAKPAYERVQAKLHVAVQEAQTQIVAVQEVVRSRSGTVTEELRTRLKAAIASARELSQSARAYVEVVRGAKFDVETLKKMPADSVNYVMHSGTMFLAEHKLDDVTDVQALVGRMWELLEAAKEVSLDLVRGKAAQPEAEKEEQVPEEEAKEEKVQEEEEKKAAPTEEDSSSDEE